MSSSSSTAASAAAPAKERVFDPSQPRSETGRVHVRAMEASLRPPLPTARFFQKPPFLILGAVSCVLFAFLLHFLQANNLLLHLHPHHSAGCRVHRGPVGAEDVALDRHEVAFISADTRQWIPTLSRDGWAGPHVAKEKMANLTQEEQGAIWAYDSRPSTHSSTAGQMVGLSIEGLPAYILDFHPHGIAIPRVPQSLGPAAPQYLYIVNHARDSDHIVVAEIKYPEDAAAKWPPQLVYRGWIHSPDHLGSINDVEAFYPLTQEEEDGSSTLLHTVWVSNYLGSAYGHISSMLVEMVMQARWGSVALCQAIEQPVASGAEPKPFETTCTLALPHLSTPNGLALSLDNSRLYVASNLPMNVLVYDLPSAIRAATSPEPLMSHGADLPLLPLRLRTVIPAGSGVDNLSVDPVSGDIFIGSHPKPLQAAQHLDDPRVRAPTQALRLHRKGDKVDADSPPPRRLLSSLSRTLSHIDYAVDEVLLSDGAEFSGASVAVWARGSRQLILGGVADDGIYVCPYPMEGEMK